jgi:hypothetical protein
MPHTSLHLPYTSWLTLISSCCVSSTAFWRENNFLAFLGRDFRPIVFQCSAAPEKFCINLKREFRKSL